MIFFGLLYITLKKERCMLKISEFAAIGLLGCFMIWRAILLSTTTERMKRQMSVQVKHLCKLNGLLPAHIKSRVSLDPFEDDRKYVLSINYETNGRSGQLARIFISKENFDTTFRCGSIARIHKISDGSMNKVFLPYCIRQIEIALNGLDRVASASKLVSAKAR